MTACEAAKRATEHTTFGPFVVEGAKSCQASLPFRPGPILVDSAQWLEEQAALHGFLVASGLELTTLKPDSKALRDARQRIRSCTFELQPRWIVEEGVPLLLTIHVDKGGNIVKVSTSWDEIDRRAARCVEQALRSANVPLPSLAPGISTYLLRTSEEAPSDEHPLFTGLR